MLASQVKLKAGSRSPSRHGEFPAGTDAVCPSCVQRLSAGPNPMRGLDGRGKLSPISSTPIILLFLSEELYLELTQEGVKRAPK